MVLGTVLNHARYNADHHGDDDDDGDDDDGSLSISWCLRAEKIDNNDGDNGCSIFEKESFVFSSMKVIMWTPVV